MLRELKVIGSKAVLAAIVVALAAPSAAYASGGGGARSAVVGDAVYITTVTFDVVSVEPSAGGEDWADSTYHMAASIYDLGSGQYRFDLSGSGTFRSWAANSPNGTGEIEAGVTGTVAGGASFVLSGPPLPSYPSYLGTFDVGGAWDSLAYLFDSYDFVSLDSYSVTYTTCDGRVAVQQMDEPNFVGDITGGPVACDTNFRLVFDGLYAFINPGYNAPTGGDAGTISPRDVCYVISSQGRPSDGRLAAICDSRWPGGPRPGWSNGAALLTSGPVYDDGTASGYWAGDEVVAVFSPYAGRLPLYRTDGAWSYLSKEYCHHMSRTGNPLTWCSSPAKGPPIEAIEYD
jgi:hypothetical protein